MGGGETVAGGHSGTVGRWWKLKDLVVKSRVSDAPSVAGLKVQVLLTHLGSHFVGGRNGLRETVWPGVREDIQTRKGDVTFGPTYVYMCTNKACGWHTAFLYFFPM